MTKEPLKTFCDRDAAAWRWGQDQYRCGKCGLVWDIDEERPPCKIMDQQQQRTDPDEGQ